MIDNDWQLIDLITGYQPATAITTAHRLGVFSVLGRVPRSAGDMAAELAVDATNLGALLEALVGIGLLRREGDRFVATPYTAERLGPGGEMGLVVAKEAVFAGAWSRLDEVVTEGRPVMEPWRFQLDRNPAQARAFLEALDVLARIAGPALHELEALAPGKRVLDVGGGLGTYARLLSEAGSRVTLVDYPLVTGWASEELEGTGVEVVGVDLFEHPSCGVPPGSMDAALVSHLIHDLAEDQAVELLRRVRSAIAPGGRVVVNDFAGDSGPGAFGALFDVMMRVETGGAAHSRATLESMLAGAGFERIRRLPYDDPLTVYIGVRP
ncbi:MAG: methyltransferase domain-containing protein [Acidimicrobiia bacterium]|nr:methyltransferase domain-containing protein [Acidimicrobiia bacterium]